MFSSEITVELLNKMNKNTIMEQIGIEYIAITSNSIKARMPVDHRTHQPFGILHGGASVVLAESLGSVASSNLIDLSKQLCVGVEINANHIRSVQSGFVFGEVKAIHIGRRTHVWEIKITNEEDKLVCISRLTTAIIDKT
jgi:1,4-dihydroxy-2-naphthoyl-CoA hydrolase